MPYRSSPAPTVRGVYLRADAGVLHVACVSAAGALLAAFVLPDAAAVRRPVRWFARRLLDRLDPPPARVRPAA